MRPAPADKKATTDAGRAAPPTSIRETSWYNFLYK